MSTKWWTWRLSARATECRTATSDMKYLCWLDDCSVERLSLASFSRILERPPVYSSSRDVLRRSTRRFSSPTKLRRSSCVNPWSLSSPSLSIFSTRAECSTRLDAHQLQWLSCILPWRNAPSSRRRSRSSSSPLSMFSVRPIM